MQTYKSNLLLDPDPPGGGGGFSPNSPEGFQALMKALPDDLRADPNFSPLKTFPDLAKSYINAQKLIGTKRTELPQANWKPEQHNEFWKQLGRPDKPEDYKPSETVKLNEAVKLDDARLKTVRDTFHTLGLSNKQGQAILDMYMGELNQTHESVTQARETAIATGTMALKEEWGDKYAANVDVATAVLKKFDNDGQIRAKLDASGLGNDPEVVKFFHNVGKLLMEDTSRGRGPGLQVNDATSALQNIAALHQDSEFQAALFKREHPGHRAAVDKWTLLHEQAFPKDAK